MINAEAKISTAIAGALTADDIAALRAADSVTFHAYHGRGFVRAHKRPGPGRDTFSTREQRLYSEPDGPTERTREITVDYSAYSYDRPGALAATQWAAFHMIHMAQYSPTWQTIVALLHTGDVLRLDWIASGGSNQYVTDAGLHADELRLQVERRARIMTFSVGHSVTPDNSARMIHRDR